MMFYNILAKRQIPTKKEKRLSMKKLWDKIFLKKLN